jgi:hypothetical protein
LHFRNDFERPQEVEDMTEFNLNRDTVRFIIDAAQEFHSQDDVNFDEEPDFDNDDFSRQLSSDFAGDPYYQEIRNTIDDLEPDQQVSLVALMWVGRGDFSLDEWEEAVQQAADSWTPRTADYLIGTALLADYLAEGLDQLESEEVAEPELAAG